MTLLWKFGLLSLLCLELTSFLLGFVYTPNLSSSIRAARGKGCGRGCPCLTCSTTKVLARGKGYEGTKSRIFQDQFKKPKDPKLEKLYKDIEIDEAVLKNQDPETKIITGDDLRSRRERDQFKVKKELDEEWSLYEAENGPFLTRLPPKRKRTEEDKALIVEVLNMLLAGKSSAIDQFERKTFIDFNDFDSFAANKIPNYDPKSNFAKNVHAWVLYHIKKRDLKVIETDEGEKWVFKKFPTGQQKNTELKRLHAIRKAKRKAEIATRQETEKNL